MSLFMFILITYNENFRCEWNGRFNTDTSKFDCVIKFCDNLISAPDTSKMSYHHQTMSLQR